MLLKMKENSLFAVLLRSPWWISFLVAAVFGLVARLVLPEQFAAYALFTGGPFFIIGCMAAWRQWRAPSAAKVAGILETVERLSWADFARAAEQGYRREGYAVTRLAGAGADFEIARPGRTALVSCKRWKAARHGIEPLRDLRAAADGRDVRECIYLANGEVTEQARRFAAEKNIELVQGARLAQLLRDAGPMNAAEKKAGKSVGKGAEKRSGR